MGARVYVFAERGFKSLVFGNGLASIDGINLLPDCFVQRLRPARAQDVHPIGRASQRVRNIYFRDRILRRDAVDGVPGDSDDLERGVRKIHRRLAQPWEGDDPSNCVAAGKVAREKGVIYHGAVDAGKNLLFGQEPSTR